MSMQMAKRVSLSRPWGLNRSPHEIEPLYPFTGVDRICSAVHRGVSRDGRFVGGGARNQELDGDTRCRDSDLDRFGPSNRRNTLRHVSLWDCIKYEMNSRGVPAHLI